MHHNLLLVHGQREYFKVKYVLPWCVLYVLGKSVTLPIHTLIIGWEIGLV